MVEEQEISGLSPQLSHVAKALLSCARGSTGSLNDF